MGNEVTLTIDDKVITVPAGTLVVDAARQAGIRIPVFCYHPELKPVGMCRVCLVDIGRPEIDRTTGQPVYEADGVTPRLRFSPKLETSCTTPVSPGMVVRTNTDKVKAARREIFEFILTSHPLDCPVCDKGGECPLQNLTMMFGPGESRFEFEDKMHLAKQVPLGELIYLDRERCIQCGRCVRFQEEIAGDAVIGFYNRGRGLEIVTYSEPGFDSIFSGNTTDICPVGALTTADFRFGARPWELTPAASICSHCAVGCNLMYNVRREARSNGRLVIKRTMPRQNEWVNGIWICDKGRFGYHYTESTQRLSQPLIRREGELVPVTWDEALEVVEDKLRASDSQVAGLAGGRLSNEDLFNLRRLIQALDGEALLHSYMGGGDLTAQVGAAPGTDLSRLGKGDVVMIIASDLHEEAPIWWLQLKQAAEHGATVISLNPRPTRQDAFAAHIVRYAYGEEVKTIRAFLPAEKESPAADALSSARRAFETAKDVLIFFGGEGMDYETSSLLARTCAELLVRTAHYGRANNGLVGVWQGPNIQGAWDMGFRPAADLKAALEKARTIYIAAADPVGDDPAAAEVLRKKFVIVQDLFLSETAKLADVVLPAAAYTEREGSYTNGLRRVQRFYPAAGALPGPRADFAIFAQIGARLGLPLEGKSAALVFDHIARRTPAYLGLSYPELARTEKQYPLVGRTAMYYEWFRICCAGAD